MINLGYALQKGERLDLDNNENIIIDIQNNINISIIKTQEDKMPDIFNDENIVKIEKNDKEYKIHFQKEMLNHDCNYNIIAYSSNDKIGDILLSFDIIKAHKGFEKIKNKALVLCNIYFNQGQWKIKINGESYENGLGEYIISRKGIK